MTYQINTSSQRQINKNSKSSQGEGGDDEYFMVDQRTAIWSMVLYNNS